jgi:hypothetical protein
VLDSFHINANRAATGLIATSLSLASRGGGGAEITVDYPPGDERQFAFAPEPLRVYEGTVTIVARLSEPLPPGTGIRATLSYQPCTEDACLSATSKSIEVAAP